MRRFAWLLVVFATFGAACPAWAGPITEYYIADGGSTLQLSVVQGSSIIRSWTMRDDAMPIAVVDTVRLYGEHPDEFGSEYDLNGNWTGVDYVWQGAPDNQSVDGGTDGVSYNYLAAYHDGGIWQFDRNWENPTRLFGVGSPTGVTYDLVTGHLWVIEYSSRTIREYTLGGSQVSSFGYSGSWLGCLAYEPATDTLWAEVFNTGEIRQYDKAGNLLQSEVIPGLAGYAWGGEFIIPEPGTLALLSLGLVGLLRRR